MAMKAQILSLLAALTLGFHMVEATPKSTSKAEAKSQQVQHHTPTDHSGKKQKGKASYYSRKFSGKKMASGKAMNPNANVAASKTLPLGTKARVKNLRNDKSTVVDIEDRGPYVKDRDIDLSPKAAEKLEMRKDGVTPVEITPIQVPQPDGSIKPDEAKK